MSLSRWPSLSEIFTAQDLMTPREQLLVHDLDQQDELKSYATQPYDVIPVVKNGRITGILEKGSPELQPLLDRWLISRDTSIPGSGQPVHRYQAKGVSNSQYNTISIAFSEDADATNKQKQPERVSQSPPRRDDK